jgi:ketopantoate reductase
MLIVTDAPAECTESVHAMARSAVHVLGGGALGTLFGGRLSAVEGLQVHILSRRAAASRKHTVRVIAANHTPVTQRLAAVPQFDPVARVV